jgi:hypothetical protein
MGPPGWLTAATPASPHESYVMSWKGILMSSSAAGVPTPEGPGSVSGAPNLPAGFPNTFTGQGDHMSGPTDNAAGLDHATGRALS